MSVVLVFLFVKTGNNSQTAVCGYSSFRRHLQSPWYLQPKRNAELTADAARVKSGIHVDLKWLICPPSRTREKASSHLYGASRTACIRRGKEALYRERQVWWSLMGHTQILQGGKSRNSCGESPVVPGIARLPQMDGTILSAVLPEHSWNVIRLKWFFQKA